jgi:CRISPR-associated protein Csm2
MENGDFYKDRQAKLIEPTFLSGRAEKFAEKIAQDGGKNKNKPSQIRKFFDEVIRLNMAAKSGQHDWDHIQPLVHMVTAKAAYAQGRGTITPGFTRFIKNSVQKIETRDDLNVFALVFEAFVGFYKLHRPKE